MLTNNSTATELSFSIETQEMIDATMTPVFEEEFKAWLKGNEAETENMRELELIDMFLTDVKGLTKQDSGNTYNHENDTDYPIDYVVYSKHDDWVYDTDSENTVIVTRVHQGGDVRCNYSSPVMYTHCTPDWLSPVVGFWLTDKDGNTVEQFEASYTNNPTYALNGCLKEIISSEPDSLHLILEIDGEIVEVTGSVYCPGM